MVPAKYRIVASLTLLIVSLYQLETVYWCLWKNAAWCFPFMLYCTGDYAFARDIWYVVIVISYLLVFGRSMQVGIAGTFARIAGRSTALEKQPECRGVNSET